MITTTKLDDGTLRITSDQGNVCVHNLSGDYVLPAGIVSVSEPDGDNRRWWEVNLRTDTAMAIGQRNRRGSVNDELMWKTDGSNLWCVEGDRIRDQTGQLQNLPFSNVQWRSGSASCDGVVQFVKGEDNIDTFIQPFNPNSGELGRGFWLKDVSGGTARKARNIVRYDHWRYGTGFLISTQEDASHEHFVTTTGTGKYWSQFEPDDANGAARWSHAATWGNVFVACRPYVGTIEAISEEGVVQEIVSQERLKELTGAKHFPQWWHGSTNGKVVAFSCLEGNRFLGVYGLDLGTRETWKIRDAYNQTIVDEDFASMSRPAITLDGKHVAWHEYPGVVYVAPVRATTPIPTPPEDDRIEKLEHRVKRLELIIEGIHGVTQ